MSYSSWFDAHAKKHKELVAKLLDKGFEKSSIIEYFEFENMVKNEKDFCPLYAENTKCHEIEYLNCYFCACPNFRFNDKGIEQVEGKTKYSYCAIDSIKGRPAHYADAIHQDCTKCEVPHVKKYIEKYFDLEWERAMKACKEEI
jgi:hypothetical protein